MFSVAWGGNEFTPLLVHYRSLDHFSPLTVNVLLGAYVLGIVPAMLLGGPLSDRHGRRPLMLPAPVLALAGSLVLAVGSHAEAVLFAGRVLSGLSLGLAMAVGTSWLKELSQAPFDPHADPGAGARRAAVSLSAGFGLGAGAAALLAQFSPLPGQLPYLAHAVVTLPALAALLRAPEPRRARAAGRLRDDLRVPAAGQRRFLLAVLPAAPWIFGCAVSAYAILPGLMIGRVRGLDVAFAGLLCLVGLGCGVAVQGLGRRIDRPGTARGTIAGLAVAIPGMALAAWVALVRDPWLSLAAAAVLGCGYGLLLVSGLLEVQRMARPGELAGLTAVFYSLSYLGFLIPAILSALHAWFDYPVMFAAGAVIASGCLGLVALADRGSTAPRGS